MTAALGATPPFAATTKLAPGDAEKRSLFGAAVAMSNDGATVLVGMPWERNPNDDPDGGTEQVGPATVKITAQGAVYVFSRAGASWRQTAKLTPTDGTDFTAFGRDVALAGDGSTAVVTSGSGRVYVFSNRAGDWVQTVTLPLTAGQTDAVFGYSVAVSADGSTVMVGAPTGGRNESGTGSAPVFGRDGGGWRRETELGAADGDVGDEFGVAVALSGDGSTALVSAEHDDEPNGHGAGSAYVFSRTGGSWTQAAKLAAANGEPRDYFGDSVALSGDGSTAIVGTTEADNANGERAGSAYVFARADGSWRQEAEHVAGDGDDGEAFGGAIAVSRDGSRAIVTAGADHTKHGHDAGSAYLFSRRDGDWTEEAKLVPPDGDDGDRFGFSVSMTADGAAAIVGAAGDEDPNGDKAGSAYVFQ